MTVVNSITLADGQATPVNHVFNRIPSTSSLLAAFRDAASGLVSVARSAITAAYRPAAPNNDGAKRTYNFTVPEYDPVLKVVRGVVRIKIDVLTPEAVGSTTRADAVAYVKNFVASATFKNAVVDGDEII